MHNKICMDAHLDLINNPFKYKHGTHQVFIHVYQKIVMNAKCNSWIKKLTHSKWMIQFMCKCWLKDVNKCINPFKYKCEALSCCVCFNIYTNKCNMQHLNNDL